MQNTFDSIYQHFKQIFIFLLIFQVVVAAVNDMDCGYSWTNLTILSLNLISFSIHDNLLM